MQPNYDLAKLFLYVPVVHTLSWRAYIYKTTKIAQSGNDIKKTYTRYLQPI